MRWIAVAMAALLVGLLTYGVAGQKTNTTIDQALAEGKRVEAPDADLDRLGAAGTQRLADYRGKVVLVNFWASWCDPCRQEAPLVERTHRRISKRNGTVLGIDTRDASEDAAKFAEEFDLTYPSLRDVDRKFARRFGTNQYPETFVVDRDGRITALRRGPVDQAWLDQNVEPLL